MTSTEPVRTTHRYSTGPVPCEKIVFPPGMTSLSVTAATRTSSSASTALNGGCEPRKPAMSSMVGSGLVAGRADLGGRQAGAMFGQDRCWPAAVHNEVVGSSYAAQEADEDERPPLVVPVVTAVYGRARPRQVDHDADLEDH